MQLHEQLHPYNISSGQLLLLLLMLIFLLRLQPFADTMTFELNVQIVMHKYALVKEYTDRRHL